METKSPEFSDKEKLRPPEKGSVYSEDGVDLSLILWMLCLCKKRIRRAHEKLECTSQDEHGHRGPAAGDVRADGTRQDAASASPQAVD